MKERGILFSTEMVRAILDGRKTQTRRVAKLPSDVIVDNWGLPFRCVKVAGGWHREGVPLSFGQIGDRLWVRETWNCPRQLGGTYQREKLIFRADSNRFGVDYSQVRWAPSLFMPRWASRITLEITHVRVERVQECSGQDAIAEGVQRRDGYYLGGPHRYVEGKTKVFTLAWQAYKDIWNHLNEKRGYGWDVNPWVWVLEFRRVPESAEAAA